MRAIHLSMIALSLLASGCSFLSPYSNLTKIDLQLQSTEELNPDLHDRPSPVVLRLVELRHQTAFEQADFFSLYQRPKQILSPDLVAIEEFELRPGEQRTLKRSAGPDSRYLGVVAAYRDLSADQWRVTLPLNPGERNGISLRLDDTGIESMTYREP